MHAEIDAARAKWKKAAASSQQTFATRIAAATEGAAALEGAAKANVTAFLKKIEAEYLNYLASVAQDATLQATVGALYVPSPPAPDTPPARLAYPSTCPHP